MVDGSKTVRTGGNAGAQGIGPGTIAIFDAVDLPIVVIGHDCKVLLINRSATTMLGLASSDIGRSPGDIFPDADNIDRLCAQVFTDGVPCRREIRLGHRHFLLRIAPYVVNDQELVGAILTLTNVTAFRASIDQAIYEREYTKAVLNTVIDPLVVLDADLRIQTANRAFYSMFGASRDEMQGVSISNLGDEEWKTSHAWESIKRNLSGQTEFRPIEIDRAFPGIGDCSVVLEPRRLAREGADMVLLAIRDITVQKRAQAEREALIERERAAHEEAEALNEVAHTLGSELDLQKLVQRVTDIATKLTAAKFGAFFYNVLNEQGESYMLYTLSGAPREAFEKFGMMPRNTPVFDTTFSGRGPRRSDDIRKDPDYGTMAPHFGMPEGHLPVCSYLAVPVKSRSGGILGGLFFGHPEPGIFSESSERLATGIASYAAIALDNARLYQQAEQQARASELLASIVDTSDDAIISKDLDGVITSWNQGAERLFGYTQAEALGQSVPELLVPQDRQQEESNILARLRKEARVEHFETVRRRKNGTLVDVSLTISPLRDAHGRIIGASSIAHDISGRKLRDAQLRKSEERFRALVTASSDVVYQMSPDWTEMRHLAGRAFIEDTLEPSVSWLDKYIHPDDQSHVMQAISKAIGNNSVFSLEHRVIRTDGTLGWTLSRAVPIVDDAGEIIEWFGAASDITELKSAEKALRQSEQRFRQLAEAGPQIVWLSGPEGELEFVNRRWVDFSGMNLEATRDPAQMETRLHPGDDVSGHWRASVAACAPFELEARLRGRDGEFRWFMMRSVPLKDEQGRVQRWFGTSTDIHETKLLQLELRRANQVLEQFAYSASHDLQEPLRNVKIFSELLSRRYTGKLDNQALEFLRQIRGGAHRMEMLIRDLLTYTQVGMIDKDPGYVDANDAMRTAVANLEAAIAETGARVDAGSLPSVRIHQIQLQQVFQNLIGNAVKYHRQDCPPVVHTMARREEGHWLFSVTDNGIGIAPEYTERIFGLFKRLHNGDEYPGTGIGLALCQRIVERHHGRIWVESEPGKGSVFYFTLPI
jgi:PAS domain S-box-containing protein